MNWMFIFSSLTPIEIFILILDIEGQILKKVKQNKKNSNYINPMSSVEEFFFSLNSLTVPGKITGLAQ